MIEGYLSVNIKIGCIDFKFMRKNVRDMRIIVHIWSYRPPLVQRVQVSALSSLVICCWSWWPLVDACFNSFDELERRTTWLTSVSWISPTSAHNSPGLPDVEYWVLIKWLASIYDLETNLNISVAVVADFDEVFASRSQSIVYILHPANVFIQVMKCYLIFRATRAVYPCPGICRRVF